MRKHLLLLVPVVLFLAACEGAPYPVSKAGEVPVRADVPGYWFMVDEDGEEVTLELYAFNDAEYVGYMSGDEDDESMLVRVFESPVGGVDIANVRCLNCDPDEGYMFGLVIADDRTLSIQWVSDDFYEEVEDATSSEQVRAALEADLDGWLTGETWIWTRGES